MIKIIHGDCRKVLKTLPDESVHCVVTSPPYWGLRDYNVAEQIGIEPTPQTYVDQLLAVFREARRVLRDDGTLWLNMGDCYHSGDRGGYRNDTHRWEASKLQKGNRGNAITVRPNRLRQNGLKDKDLCGIPWRVAFALQADDWYLRQDIIWSKPNPMPESVTDRCTKAHEYIFLLSKNARYYYDADAIAQPFADDRLGNPGVYARTSQAAKGANRDRADTGFLNNGGGWNGNGDKAKRNRRDVWEIATQPYSEAHFATFPPALIEPCILAGCPKGGTVLDPFGGAGTTGMVADRLGRNAILIELNPEYAAMAECRIRADAGMFSSIEIG